MHVVLTCNFSPWSRYRGGGQRSTHQLACALAARGHRVSVLYTKAPWERVDVPPVPYRIVWATLLDLVSRRDAPLRPLSALSVARALRSLGETPAVVHAQGEEGLFARQAAGCPLVLTPRYPSYPAPMFDDAAGLGSWLAHTKYHALRATAQQASWVCPTSEASANEVRRALRVERVRVIPNGVDPAYLARERALDAPHGPLLFFGRLERSKGVDVLLEAFERLQHVRELHIVGEGMEHRWLQREARGRRITLHGWASAEQLAMRLASASLAVLPSREESFGNAMVEAMAAGTPLVSTTAGSLPELIAHGETGVLVPAGDAGALAEAIAGLLADPGRAERLGTAGRSEVRAKYSWDSVAARYEQLYAMPLQAAR
jgi:glycosyltransferase involved in cell wall biosynthesis